MDRIAILKNTVKDYAWGSLSAIPELLDETPPYKRPQAELWMGAHPQAPSLVAVEGSWQSLLDLISNTPVGFLGAEAARKFDNKLPYLFKVIAAARPLSIQAHPDRDQARRGFARENHCAIPLDAPQRTYKDPNHKPEILCALSPFWALIGFRPVPEFLAAARAMPWAGSQRNRML